MAAFHGISINIKAYESFFFEFFHSIYHKYMKKFIHAIQVQVKPLHHDLNVFINVFIFFIRQNVFCILVELVEVQFQTCLVMQNIFCKYIIRNFVENTASMSSLKKLKALMNISSCDFSLMWYQLVVLLCSNTVTDYTELLS